MLISLKIAHDSSMRSLSAHFSKACLHASFNDVWQAIASGSRPAWRLHHVSPAHMPSPTVWCREGTQYSPCPEEDALSCYAGAADGSVKVWDRRNLSTALHSFRPHNKPIMRVEWAPYKKGKLPMHSLYIGIMCHIVCF